MTEMADPTGCFAGCSAPTGCSAGLTAQSFTGWCPSSAAASYITATAHTNCFTASFTIYVPTLDPSCCCLIL